VFHASCIAKADCIFIQIGARELTKRCMLHIAARGELTLRIGGFHDKTQFISHAALLRPAAPKSFLIGDE